LPYRELKREIPRDVVPIDHGVRWLPPALVVLLILAMASALRAEPAWDTPGAFRPYLVIVAEPNVLAVADPSAA